VKPLRPTTAAATGAVRRSGALLPLLLLPILLGGLFDPVFRDTADIDDLWEVGCLAIAGLGLLLRMLVAGRERPFGLDTTGIYSLVRHPRVLGNVLVWLGLALFPRCWPAVLASALALWLAYRPHMARRDAALHQRFGAAFEAWARRTPVLRPALSRWEPSIAGMSWRTALLRESTPLLATVAAFFLLEVVGDMVVGEPLQLEPEWLILLGAAAATWVGVRLAWGGEALAPILSRPAESAWQPPLGLLLAAACVLAWDASGADLLVAHAMGGIDGFPWRDHWLTATVLHAGLRALAWVGVLWLVVSVRWPTGVLRALTRRERVWLLATVLASMLLVSTIKRWSLTSCPWDLEAFGGAATYVSHWQWGLSDGGPGHCFPAGHASGGFAFIAGAYALRRAHPRAARAWLIAAVIAGALMGLGQQWRGAHFASHTLWSAWLCWACAWLSAAVFLRHNVRP
jgi:membrane-associated PAP2 superfamily phosphatase/protein-S-isoprenylcysteine O-methyltransferase Ste14